jgi:two-component system sensor histidine kinase YcbA
MKGLKKIISASILVALASQINLGLSESDFVVSAGVIIFVTFLYYYEDINSISMGMLSAVMVFLLRLAVYQVTIGYNNDVFIAYMPEMLFYIFYPLLYKLLIKNGRKHNIGFVFFALISCDFLLNSIEVFFRYFIFADTIIIEVIPSLLVVSIVRSSLVLAILVAFNYYDLMLTKREHEDRYKKLLWLTSQLKTEIFWIEKNMDNIEKVMSQSYNLFEQISNNQNKDNWANNALNIARDVHEIKKENGLVVRGIKSITENELNDNGMEYKDINNILLETMIRESKNINKHIEFEFVMGENFYTDKHYYLMSVLRNLIMNSMDAISESQFDAKISVVHSVDEIDHIFQISDNGSGINENDINEIFSPGFSTKINYDTGEINRGLGLSIVQYIVEEQLKGEVKVNSKLGIGTIFNINIPKIILEEKSNENIHS